MIPSQNKTHAKNSPKAVNTFSAERRPKGRAQSTNVWSCYWMHWSAGCTGTMRYAFDKSILTKPVARPNWDIKSTTSSTEANDREHRLEEMPSLILWPLGKDKSTINLHFAEWGFGTRPTGLTWTWCKEGIGITLSECSLSRRYCVITLGFSVEYRWLLMAHCWCWTDPCSYPIRNPFGNPFAM